MSRPIFARRAFRAVACVFFAGCALFSIAFMSSIAALDSGYLSTLDRVSKIGGLLTCVTMPQCVLGFGYAYFLFKTANLPSKNDIPVVIVACILSMLTILGVTIAQLRTVSFLYASSCRVLVTMLVWLSITVAYYSCAKWCFDIMLDISKKAYSQAKINNTNCQLENNKWEWLIRLAPLVFLLAWIPYLILPAPGTVSYDMTWMIRQFQGIQGYSTHHPLQATLLYGAIYSVGEWLGGGSANAGVLTITVVQTAAWIAACTFEIKIIQSLRAPFWFGVLSVCFFTLSPVFGTYCQYVVKDSLFGVFFVLYASLFVLYVKDPESFSRSKLSFTFLLVASFAIGVLRNNGFFVVLLSLPFLGLLHKGLKRKLISVIPFALIIVLIPITNLGLQIALNASSGSVAEALSIPFQQTARYASQHADDVEAWEYEILDKTLDYEHIVRNYTWEQSDAVKNTYKGAPLGDYFHVWAVQGLRHPGTYIDATLVQTYGYWYPEMGTTSYWQEGYCYETSYPASASWTRDDAESFGWYQWFPDADQFMQKEIINRYRAIPLLSLFLGAAIYVWVLLLEIGFLFYAKKDGVKRRNALILLPCFILLLTCIAGPMCGSVRYTLGIIAVFPLLVGATSFFVSSSNGVSDNNML